MLIINNISGWLLGAVVTYGISNVPIRIHGIFTADTFIVRWSVWHYVAATVTAFVMVMAARSTR